MWWNMLESCFNYLVKRRFSLILTNSSKGADTILVLHQIVVADWLREGNHCLFEGCYEILWMLAFLFDQTNYSVKVVGVKGCINLIQNVERGWLTFLKSQKHANSDNCFLSSWKLMPFSDWFFFGIEWNQNGDGISDFDHSSISFVDFLQSNFCFSIDSDKWKDFSKVILEFFEYLANAFIFLSSKLLYKISDALFDSFKFSQFFNLILIFLIPSLYFRKGEFFQGTEYSNFFPFLIANSADAETVGVFFFLDILNGHVKFTKFLKFFRVELYLIFNDTYIGEMGVILTLDCAYFVFSGLELLFQFIFLSLENLVVSFKLFFELFSSNKGKVEILLKGKFVLYVLSFFVDLFFIFYYFLQFSFDLAFLLCFFVVDLQSFFIRLFDLGKFLHIYGYSFFINILQNLFLGMNIRGKFILLLLKFLLFLFKLFVRFFIFLKFLNLRMNIS